MAREPLSPQDMAARLGHDFARPERLERALTHRGAAQEAGLPDDNERLEFLGDRVLSLIVADLLMARFPGESEGDLSRRHASLVRRETLARVARRTGLDAALLLSRTEEDGGGRENPALLTDACEAAIGALYADGGLDAARRFVESEWSGLIGENLRPPQDAKTALQEWAQGSGRPLPQYREVARKGPAHSPVFMIEVQVADSPPARGEGASKRVAEQVAAAAFLARIGKGVDG
ncbi:MAG: ribonuclease III [Rhodospirillaceae bacterium]|nr:ribonuclease III [Rhodospirillaceae bacterium]